MENEAKGKGKKFLFGCATGCAALLILGVGSCVGFAVWLDRPAELLEPRILFGPGTTGYLEWTLTEDDPGSRAFVLHLAELMQVQADSRSDRPAFLERILSRGQAKNRENMLELLPVVFLWTMEAVEGRDSQHVMSLSMERLGNRLTLADMGLGWIFRFSDELETIRHGGEKIYVAADDDFSLVFFIHAKNLFVASDVEVAQLTVDRLRQPTSAAVESEPSDLFAMLPDKALRGVVSNVDGNLAGIWEYLAGVEEADMDATPIDWSPIRLITLSGGLSGPTAFDGVLELHCKDADWAAANAESFITALQASYRRAHLPIETDVSIDGDRILVVLRLDDLPAFIDEL